MSRSIDDTVSIAAAIAQVLAPGDVVVLSGDLGAGKTAFVQGAARGLGVRARVQSPSFVLVRTYDADIPITHADVYRLNHLQELIDLGVEELFDPDRVLFIEWGDAVAGELPDHGLDVVIARGEDDSRTIVLATRGARWADRTAPLTRAVEPWAVTRR